MKITKKVWGNVVRACCEAVGSKRTVEIGDRSWPAMTDPNAGMNMLLWGEDSDLDSPCGYQDAIGREMSEWHGWVAFDCYLMNPPARAERTGDSLDCNCYVLVEAATGEVKYASDNDMGYRAEIERIIGRPLPEEVS